MGPEVLIAILVPLGGMAMILGIVYLYKKENLAMIEKGMNPKVYRPAPYTALKYGLLLVGIALIAIFGGLGLILSYRIEKKEVLDKNVE